MSFRGASVSQDQLFDAIRFEVAVRYLGRLLYGDAEDFDTPEQRWDFYSRLHRFATIEAMPVEVKNFTAKIAEPADADLQAYFDNYKDQFSIPTNPEPGSKRPRKRRSAISRPRSRTSSRKRNRK